MIITYEKCPVCETPGMKVEHGTMNEGGSFIHVEHCTECGDHYPIVGYVCPHCLAAREEQKRVVAALMNSHRKEDLQANNN